MAESSYRKLTVSPQSREIVLLGYAVKLTKSEHAILMSLMESDEEGVEIAGLRESIGTSSVSVHVCNINRKARELSGRSLIVYANKRYKINKNM